MTEWIEMPVCPMCHRPVFDGECHTQTVTYTPARLSFEEVRDLTLKGFVVSSCVVTRREAQA
jgi:hypothetical protein